MLESISQILGSLRKGRFFERRSQRGEDLHLYKKSVNLQIIDILLVKYALA